MVESKVVAQHLGLGCHLLVGAIPSFLVLNAGFIQVFVNIVVVGIVTDLPRNNVGMDVLKRGGFLVARRFEFSIFLGCQEYP